MMRTVVIIALTLSLGACAFGKSGDQVALAVGQASAKACPAEGSEQPCAEAEGGGFSEAFMGVIKQALALPGGLLRSAGAALP